MILSGNLKSQIRNWFSYSHICSSFLLNILAGISNAKCLFGRFYFNALLKLELWKGIQRGCCVHVWFERFYSMCQQKLVMLVSLKLLFLYRKLRFRWFFYDLILKIAIKFVSPCVYAVILKRCLNVLFERKGSSECGSRNE